LLALHVGGLSSPLQDEVNPTVGAVGSLPNLISLATVGLRHPSLKVSPAEGTDRVEVLVQTEEFVPPTPVELAHKSEQCDESRRGGCHRRPCWKKGECGVGSFKVSAEGINLDYKDTNWILYDFDWNNDE